jgi:hypothetical protein
MRHTYTDGEILYIKFISKGRTTYEIVDMFNKNFGTDVTREQIRALMKNHDIRSDIDRKNLKIFMPRLFNEVQEKFIRDNCKGINTIQLTKLFNEYFKTNFTQPQIRNYMHRYGITNGVNCTFKKGSVPINKGKKGMPSHPNMIATQFKKGVKPRNWLPVGSERINTDGYVDIKIAEPNKWKGKHKIIWEEHHGAIPEGHVVIFGDRNRHNFDIDNLILVSKKQLLIMNQNRLIQNDTELTKTGVIIADLLSKIKESEKRLNGK